VKLVGLADDFRIFDLTAIQRWIIYPFICQSVF